MSLACSCYLLFLLCLSFHACNARRALGSLHSNHNKSQHKSHLFSNKADYEEHNKGMEKLSGNQSKAVVKAQSCDDKTGDELRSVNNGDVEYHRVKRSQASVSWPVPHKKRREKQPGFNLDYSPPKTHPPSHN